jgi:hypothetical protein
MGFRTIWTVSSMQSRFAWWWILVLLVLLLAPGPAGRLLLDLVGGVTLLLLLLPVALGGAAWLGWAVLQRRLRTCTACGFRSLGTEICPACGTVFSDPAGAGGDAAAQDLNLRFDARDVTIDVTARDLDEES